MTLQRAMAMSGCSSCRNARASALFGLDTTMRGTAVEIGGVAVAQARDGLRLPRLVRGGEAQPGVGAKGEDVEELQPADAANLAAGGAPEPPWRRHE